MTFLKNLVLHWILPLVAAVLIYSGIQVFRAPDVQVGDDGLAPDFTLIDTDGEAVSLADYRGKRVLLNFWAEWCGPCKAEVPAINSFAKRNPDIAVLGVAVDSGNLEAVTEHAERLGIRYPVVRGTGSVQRAYGVKTLPTTFLVGADGTLDKMHVGLITRPQLAAWAR